MMDRYFAITSNNFNNYSFSSSNIQLNASKKATKFDGGANEPDNLKSSEAAKTQNARNGDIPVLANTGVQNSGKSTNSAVAGNANANFRNNRNLNDRNVPDLSRTGNFNMLTRYNPINLSGPLISKRVIDRNLLVNPARFSYQESVIMNFTVKPINSRLNRQALVWASKVDTLAEVDKYRIFGRERYSGYYVRLLQEIFVYSFYKSLLLGANEYRIDQVSDANHCLVGHSMLYYMLYKRKFSFDIGGVFVNYELNISQEDLTFITEEAKKYSFIRDSISEYTNRFNISNSVLERYIEGLVMSLSAAKSDILFVRLSDSVKIMNFTNISHNPLANSFWSKEQKRWYYIYNEFSHINGDTLLYGKACFITYKGTGSPSLQDYQSVVNTEDHEILVKYETSCVSSSKFYDVRMNEDNLEGKDQSQKKV